MLGFQSWEQVTSEALAQAEKDGALGMDEAIQRDQQTVWQGRLTAAEVQPRFQLPAVVPLPLAGEVMALCLRLAITTEARGPSRSD